MLDGFEKETQTHTERERESEHYMFVFVNNTDDFSICTLYTSDMYKGTRGIAVQIKAHAKKRREKNQHLAEQERETHRKHSCYFWYIFMPT